MMHRRTHLQVLAWWCLAGWWPAVRARHQVAKPKLDHAANDVVFDQSGSAGNGAFAIGLFSGADTAAFARAASALRRRTNYRCTLTHTSRNKWKLRYARGLIDLWFSTPGARIDVIVIKDDEAYARAKPAERMSRYTDLVSRLLDGSPSRRRGAVRLVTQPHYKPAQQAQFEKLLASRSAALGEITRIGEPASDVLQLVDLIVGAIQASQKSTHADVENPTKRAVFEHLRKRLGVKTLDGQVVHHASCSVTYV